MQRTAVPRQFGTRRQAQIRAVAIIGALVVLAALSPFAFMTANRANATAEEALAFTADAPQPIHRAVAEVAAARWAWGGSGAIPVPGAAASADLIGRPGLDERTMDLLLLDDSDVDDESRVGLDITQVVWAGAEFVGTATDGLESHRFLVVTEGGLLRLTISVQSVERENAAPLGAVAGIPSVEPWIDRPELQEAEGVQWVGVGDPAVVGENIHNSIESWAEAFALGDSTGLLAATGDPEGRIYVGLGGFQARETSVPFGAVRESDGLLVARVVISVLADTGVALDLSYDVLIEGANEPFPNVVAWGPIGTGPALTQYGNAVPAGSILYPGLPVQVNNELDPRQFARRAQEVLENLAAIERAYARDIGNGQYATFDTLDSTTFSNVFNEALAPLEGTRANVEGRIYENGIGFCVEAVLAGDAFHATHLTGVVPGRCPLELEDAIAEVQVDTPVADATDAPATGDTEAVDPDAQAADDTTGEAAE